MGQAFQIETDGSSSTFEQALPVFINCRLIFSRGRRESSIRKGLINCIIDLVNTELLLLIV